MPESPHRKGIHPMRAYVSLKSLECDIPTESCRLFTRMRRQKGPGEAETSKDLGADLGLHQ